MNASSVMPMLSVTDMTRALAFYQRVLGGKQTYQFPPEGGPAYLTLKFGETELGIGLISDKPLHGIPQRPATGHRIELCINVDDVDQAIVELEEIGTRVVMPEQELPWGERSAYVEDPEGNLVLLVETA